MFVSIGERIINLDQVTDVAWEVKYRHGGPGERVLVVYLATAAAASVGASDWTTEARCLVFKGDEASRVWDRFRGLCLADFLE